MIENQKPGILGAECWDCIEDELEFINPGKKERQRIYAENVKENFKKIIRIFLAILGLSVIISIFIIYNVNKDNPDQAKYYQKLETVKDLINYINETF